MRHPILLAPILMILVAMTSCGTLVRVVGDGGTPVSGARVQVVYNSFSYPSNCSPGGTTDSSGYVRLDDAWLRRPMFGMLVPVGVWVTTASRTWHFNYPPPYVLQVTDSPWPPVQPHAIEHDHALAADGQPREVR